MRLRSWVYCFFVGATVMCCLVATSGAFAQEGKRYLATFKYIDGSTGQACLAFGDRPPDSMRVEMPSGDQDGQWAHLKNGKQKKWFMILGDDGWMVVGKRVGKAGRLKGDLLFLDGDDTTGQATLTAVLDPDCLPGELDG